MAAGRDLPSDQAVKFGDLQYKYIVQSEHIFAKKQPSFLQHAQCSHCKCCISYGNSVRLSVRLSVRHTPVLCQNDGT